MPLTAADIKFFASAANTDNADGGGARASAVVQNGVLHNLFPAVAAGDRTTGRVRIRKLFPSLANTDTTPLLGASVAINELPGDPGVSLALFRYGDASTTRAQALAAFKAGTRGVTNGFSFVSLSATAASRVLAGSVSVSVGAVVVLYEATPQFPALTNQVFAGPTLTQASPTFTGKAYIRRVTATSPGTSITVDKAMPAAMTVGVVLLTVNGGLRAYAPVKLRDDTLTGSATINAESAFVQVAGRAESVAVGTAGVEGFGTLTDDAALATAATANQHNMASTVGTKYALQPGDAVTLFHEAAMSPATLSPGTVSTGRTTLEQITVRGNDGLDIAVFLRGGPTPAGVGCTANLDAGTLTVTSTTGWPQPVTVLHRIAHRSAIDNMDAGTIVLTTPVTRDFPAGSVLSPHLPLSDVAAATPVKFTQQAWTRQWSDSVIGNTAASVYSGDIAVTNQGAESDRYAVVFGDALAFTVYSERLGLLGTGSTAAVFAPLNPATGAPLFTLSPANWVSSIPVGTTLRFNTIGAYAPIWVVQSIAPSAPSTGTSRAVVRLHGSV